MAGDADGGAAGPPEQKLNVTGMIGLIVFYLIIFCAGVVAHKWVFIERTKNTVLQINDIFVHWREPYALNHECLPVSH